MCWLCRSLRFTSSSKSDRRGPSKINNAEDAEHAEKQIGRTTSRPANNDLLHMTNSGEMTHDLNSPRGRRAALEGIRADRNSIRDQHQLLLDLFQREMDFRRSAALEDDFDGNCFEHIYWCALLLYLIGDLADIDLMWEGKQIDMDTACGFDFQFLVGAGVDETISYLRENGKNEIADYLQNLKDSKELDNLPQWERFRIDYFYRTTGGVNDGKYGQ
jgi:hypothetical protein